MTTEAVEPPPQGQLDVLVWSLEDGVPRTVWLRDYEGAYEIVGERRGLILTGGSNLWSLEAVTEERDVCECDGATCASTFRMPYDRLELVDLETGASRPLFGDAPWDSVDNGQLRDFEFSTIPLGTVGPYLFAVECVDATYCGAEPEMACTFQALDLGSLESVVVGPAPGDDGFERRRAVHGLALDLRDIGLEDAPSLELTAMMPDYREGGDLEMRHQYSVDTSREHADGRWSTHTRSVSVPSRLIPDTIFEFSDTPDILEFFWAVEVPRGPVGWSLLQTGGSRVQRWLDLFLRG